MNSPLLLTTLTLILAAPDGFAKSELETLRALCAEQERQIRQLEVENSNLRSDSVESSVSKTQLEAKASSKPSPTETSVPADSTYTVAAGDSIEKIARKVGLTPEKLAEANGLKPSGIIRPGQKLKVAGAHTPATGAATSPAQSMVSAPIASRARNDEKTHTIQQGETYFSISKKYKVRTEALMEANPGVKASAMRPGQILKITSGSSTTTTISAPAASRAPAEIPAAPALKTADLKSSAPANPVSAVAHAMAPETKTAEARPAASTVESAPAAASHQTKFRSVTIHDQTTYGEFAAKHGTDAERLNALNGLDLTTATVLAKGSELYVPATP